jgi:hypothetical protein
MTSHWHSRKRGTSSLALLGALVLCLVGCAAQKPTNKLPRPGTGLAEYTQLVNGSQQGVKASMRALDAVDAQTPRCSPAVVSAFSTVVDRLAVESIKVRARSQVIQARGDAYFENWQANMDSMSDPKVRMQAELHRSELQQSFARIKSISQDIRSAFQGYLAGLRSLRSELENEGGVLAKDSIKQLIATTRQSGLRVEDGLDAIAKELKSMTAMLSPPDVTVKQ